MPKEVEITIGDRLYVVEVPEDKTVQDCINQYSKAKIEIALSWETDFGTIQELRANIVSESERVAFILYALWGIQNDSVPVQADRRQEEVWNWVSRY